MRRRFLFVAFLLLAFVPLSAVQSPSTPAKPAEPEARDLTPDEAGRVLAGIYTNKVLGLEVKPIPDWALLSRGEMNVNEAFGREALGLKLGGTNRHRVFGMHDGRGSNVSMAIVPIPLEVKDKDVADREAKLIEYAKRDLPNPKVTKETVLLNSAQHEFSGFRVEYTVAGRTIYQSLQTTVCKGFLVGVTSTSTTPQGLSATLVAMKKVMAWK